MKKTALIIPCYNEEKRIKETYLLELINTTTATIYIANDGSKDRTIDVINNFATKYPYRCFVIDYKENEGKANTIFKSTNYLLAQKKYDFIGYFDADFSTPSSEIKRLIVEVENSEFKFLFGSRILLLNSGIKRKLYRHIIGRVIITIINIKFKLGIYDTQCGAKLFSSEIIEKVFNRPFKTSWLFDIEIFIRLKKMDFLKYGKEFPIYNWKDVDDSKLGWRTAFKIINEICIVMKNY